MKAPPFSYLRPEDLDAALEVLAAHKGDAVVLAGGQSLMPSLALRLARPAALVDINRISQLTGIELRGDRVRIGALARHCEIAQSDLVASHLPLLRTALGHVGHRGVRNRGTFGGSLANGDPAAELVACAVALDATVQLRSLRDERRVAAGDFFQSPLETDRRPDEILTEVLVPARRPDEVFGFRELSRRTGDFAMVGVAARARLLEAGLRDLRLVVFGCEARPLLSKAAARLVEGTPMDEASARQIAAAVAQEMDPMADLAGDASVKRRQARALVARLLMEMAHG